MGWEQLPALCIYLTPPPFNSSVYPLEKKCMLLLLFYSQKPVLLVSLSQARGPSSAINVAFLAPAARGNHLKRGLTYFYKDVQEFQLQSRGDVFLSLNCKEAGLFVIFVIRDIFGGTDLKQPLLVVSTGFPDRGKKEKYH